jgi:signal transduction histidine kinase
MKRLFDDTLFKRLFLLMWAALVLSHLAGFLSVQQWLPFPDEGARPPGLPLMPSLPPMDLPSGGDGPPDGSPLGRWLWLDYLVRVLVIGAAAWFGARWLSAPMNRLANASKTLGQAIGSNTSLPVLDAQRGTLEVRQAAEVFNTMATRLHEQFSAQALLMAAISHDLRTPLARLRLRLEQMPASPDAERCVADVREMDQLIASVLEMVQLQHQPAAQQRVDLYALVQALADDFAEQGQPVRLDVPAEGVQALVRGRAAALNRVVGNLLGNALRHGGSAEISVRVLPEQVQVVIDDQGPGIPADQLEAVFQPFYRVDASRSRQTGGTGLGLYIARDLAQQHGGQVTLFNRSGGGLRAELVLPRAA